MCMQTLSVRNFGLGPYRIRFAGLVETHVPTARRDQYSDQLRAVGWKLSELTGARPSPSTTRGAAMLARSHLRVESSLDVVSCAQTVDDHEPTDFAAAIVHGCHSRILLLLVTSRTLRALVRPISRNSRVWERSYTPCTFHVWLWEISAWHLSNLL